MQAKVHNPAGCFALTHQLVQTGAQHFDAVAGRCGTAGKHVEVVHVIRIWNTDDRAVVGADHIWLIVVEIIAIGKDAELLEDGRRMAAATNGGRQPGLGWPTVIAR